MAKFPRLMHDTPGGTAGKDRQHRATGGQVSTATPTKTPEGNAETAANQPSEGDVLLWHPDEDGWD